MLSLLWAGAEIEVRGMPNGIFHPWVRWDSGVEIFGRFFRRRHRRRRRRRRPLPPDKKTCVCVCVSQNRQHVMICVEMIV